MSQETLKKDQLPADGGQSRDSDHEDENQERFWGEARRRLMVA